MVTHLVHELDPNGKQLRVVKYTDYAAETALIDQEVLTSQSSRAPLHLAFPAKLAGR